MESPVPACPAASVSCGLSPRLPEPGKAAFEADVLELVAPPRHQLVGVALVGGVPDNGVGGTVENAVQGEGELDDPEIGSEMAAPLGYDGDYGIPGLLRHLGELFIRKSPEIARGIDPVEEAWGHRRSLWRVGRQRAGMRLLTIPLKYVDQP